MDHPDFGKAIICPDCTGKPQPAGLPDRLKNKTFRDFDVSLNKGMKGAYDRCKRLADGKEWCCVMVGSTGLGKSHLAAATLYQHPQAGYFWETGDLLRRLRTECFGEMGPKTPESEALWRWQDYRPVLVLDDMGAEKWTEWASQTLYAILNARYQSRLPTIITSNVAEAVDDRLLSRYFEGSVQCTGQDIRKVKRW